jgi:hypothetical protein
MKKSIILVLFLFTLVHGFAQKNDHHRAMKMLEERGEIFFAFTAPEHDLNYLSRIVSIAKLDGDSIWAYANKKSFRLFNNLNLDYRLLTPPSMLHQPFMLDGAAARGRSDWDFYPTYEGYEDIMDQFAIDYPDLCEVVNIKTLSSGRKLLLIHINDDLETDQDEPEFLYTSSMHGNETSGYVTMLHLIDYLLENYGTDEQVTNLVNNVDIWINPLANPDGTYAGGNNTIFGATRGNANGVDLNRNFPDPEDGPHPDGNEYQEETEAFMEFAEDHDFVMSANFHDGAEVVNYPWDTWSRRHADDDWWIYVSRQYADTVHEYGPPGYFNDFNNGITNGYDWYSISGGRQDYMNYFHHCRESTIEIHEQFTLPASMLESIWNYHHRSMLNYMEHTLYGVRGLVTNKVNGNPVPAKVYVENHDLDESFVYASNPIGNYHRPIKEGIYDFTFSSFGYYDQTVENVDPEDMNTLILDIELQPYQSLTADFYASDTIIAAGEPIDFFDNSVGEDIVSWEWTFEGASPSNSSEQNPENISYEETGLFDVTLKVTDDDGATNTLTKEDYIRVTEVFTMKDTTVYVCDGLFYDSGGEAGEYQDGEDITMTFISFLESGRLKVTFREFDVEPESDCAHDYLEAFDGTNTDAPIIGSWCGTELPPTMVVTNIEGAVTFRFHSNEMITRPGWKAEITCDTSVDISQVEKDQVTVYPNPADEYVRIGSPLKISAISIINALGEQIEQQNPNTNTSLINTSQLDPGIYFVSIQTGKQTIVKKIIINR